MSKVMAAFDKKTLMVTDVGCFFSACSWRARAHASEILSALETTTKHNAAAQQSSHGWFAPSGLSTVIETIQTHAASK
jgi:hypothetical protein